MVINGKSAAGALVKARAAIGATVVKDAKANYGKYATLAAVMEAISPALAANGLALVQEAELEDGAVTIGTALVHESGETIEFCPLTMPLAQRTAQAVGSAITYARRYQLTAVFGLAPDDDDGDAATKMPQTAQERQNGRAASNHTAPAPKTQQRPATQPSANVDEAEPVNPDGPERKDSPAHRRLFAVGNEVFGPDWNDGARAWLIRQYTKLTTPEQVRESAAQLSDDEKDVLGDYIGENATALQDAWGKQKAKLAKMKVAA